MNSLSIVSTSELVKIWTKVALHSFGGPAGQISVIHKLVVEDKKIISEEQFLHALNFCMLLPGPEAQQLATYMGWLMAKWRGGLIAGGLFILPGFLSILLLSYLYINFQDVPLVQGLFYGVKPAIIAIICAALYRISQKSLQSTFYWLLAVLAFVALFFYNISFPIVVIFAAVVGMLYGKLIPTSDKTLSTNMTFPPIIKTIRTLLIWLILWTTPIILVFVLFGEQSTFHSLNLFFSKMSMVTFGGAYAALSYVAQKAVEEYGWLIGTEMMDALAMAETTPGPLIQSVQFVGFMGAYRFPDISSPSLSALIGSVLTTWMTFAPCFLWIFTFAPYVEYIRGHKAFSDSLKGITAAIVGVIFNLSLWFVLKALFSQSQKVVSFSLDFEYPILSSIDWFACGICLLAFYMQFKAKKKMHFILLVSTISGILVQYLKPIFFH